MSKSINLINNILLTEGYIYSPEEENRTFKVDRNVFNKNSKYILNKFKRIYNRSLKNKQSMII